MAMAIEGNPPLLQTTEQEELEVVVVVRILQEHDKVAIHIKA